MSIKQVKDWIVALIFPPVCRGCGERLSIFSPHLPGVLCTACRQCWEQEKGEQCSFCHARHDACTCLPRALETSGVDGFVHLTQYRPHVKSVSSTMILRGKDNNDRQMFRFLAEELAQRLRPVLDPDKETVITYVPRRRAAVRTIGHDHAKQIAAALSEVLGHPLVVAVRRRPLTHQQKQLDAAERKDNAERSFEASAHVNLVGKRVILLDDVCTTGTSLAACANLLRASGASGIVCAVIAKTGKSD